MQPDDFLASSESDEEDGAYIPEAEEANVEERPWTIVMLPNGRRSIHRQKKSLGLGYVHITYCSRAMEWTNLRQAIKRFLETMGLPEKIKTLELITFGCKHVRPLAKLIYKPFVVFCEFNIKDIPSALSICTCRSNRWKNYVDKETTEDQELESHPHVRTANLDCIRDSKLREALEGGPNHIPLLPTCLNEVVNELLNAWSNITPLLNMDTKLQERGTDWLREYLWQELKFGADNNIGGHKFSATQCLSNDALEELQYLLRHFYFSGLDKASNNLSIICIWHIRHAALKRLSGPDFIHSEKHMETILSDIREELDVLVPEIWFKHLGLPYIMATYKLHKQKYRWITSAAVCTFTGVASIITQALLLIVTEICTWCGIQTKAIYNLHRKKINLCWMIDSVFEFVLNLPQQTKAIFTVDITRCFETIPLNGEDNLQAALEFVIRKAFTHHNGSKRKHNIWVHIDTNIGKADRAKWDTKIPGKTCWVELSMERLFSLQQWLINNCFIRLGDEIWRQSHGIPMGFSCSPLWCNLYFMTYEIRFILRLLKLGKFDLAAQFEQTYRYIDDLCASNNPGIGLFIDTKQPRLDSNPFWIYPLQLVELQPVMEKTVCNKLDWGTCAHFLNMQIEITDIDHGFYCTTKYDKRRSLLFKFQQYICFKSNPPVTQAYNIALSQAVPIIYMASSAENALSEIEILVNTLIRNGFAGPRLYRMILRFCQLENFPGIKFSTHRLASLLQDRAFKTSRSRD